MTNGSPERRPVISPNDGLAFEHWQPISATDIANQLERLGPARRDLNDDIGLRRTLLDQCAAALERARPKLVDLVVREVAKKPSEADGEVDYAISFLAHCRDLLDDMSFERTLENGHVIKDVGLAGALLICPFNDPIAGLTRKIAPAIAAGCPVVLKPSSLSILCAREMFSAFRSEGVGDHIQLLATGDPLLVQSVLEHDDIGIVSFTGSTEVGRNLAAKWRRSRQKIGDGARRQLSVRGFLEMPIWSSPQTTWSSVSSRPPARPVRRSTACLWPRASIGSLRTG